MELKEDPKTASTDKQKEAVSYPEGAKFKVTMEGGKVMFLKSINRQQLGVVLSMIMPANGQPDYIRAGELIIDNCAMKEEGDFEAIKSDEMLYVGACFQAYQIIELKTGEIKKL